MSDSPWLRALACAAVLAGCGPSVASDASSPTDASQSTDAPAGDVNAPDAAPGDTGVTPGEAIHTPDRTWTWVDFPDSVCDDGSPTGLGVSLANNSSNVLLFFNGGGACWDDNTCLVLNSSTHGPFGSAQFAPLANGGFGAGSGFDRNAAQNPFRDWNMVFVPYCTGDLHAGSRTAMYTPPGGSPRAFQHQGRTNVLAYLRRLLATFPAPGQVMVSGSSAGGYGALLNYDLLRTAWPSATVQLLDDSGPALDAMGIPAAERAAWFSAWSLGAVLDPLCGPSCHDDLSALYTVLATRYPHDRLALLSSQQDATIRTYLQLTGPQFQASLERMLAARFEGSATLRYFVTAGETHTMLGAPGSYTAGGQGLWDWLRAEVTAGADWTSRHP